jgi:sulfide:quinone oxidoreductase
MARVAVLGGGFGGVATAVALRRRLAAQDEVMLIDRRDDFAMGIRKTWHILGISPLAYGTRHLASLREQGVMFVHGEITALDPARRGLRVDRAEVEADALVLALGAAHAVDAVPGLAEHGADAWTLGTIDRAHAAVDGFRGGRVLVGIFGAPYSCPPAPFELALLLVDRLEERGIAADVAVFGPAPITLPILGAAGCATLDGRLADRGIPYLAGRTAAAVHPDAVEFTSGEREPFDLLLAIPPHRVPRVLVDAGLAAPDGWVKANPATLETDHAGVYAIGDCTSIGLSNGMALPKAGAFAERAGETVVERIAARLDGEEPRATFDGVGACFIEMGGGEASMIRGDFFADPPLASLTEPTLEQRAEKERFESDRLLRWFGA